jgi:hypothetical protein
VALARIGVSEEYFTTFIKVFLPSVLQLMVTAIFPISLVVFTLMMDAIRSSEISVLTRVTWHHMPEDGIPRSQRCENLKSYIF